MGPLHSLLGRDKLCSKGSYINPCISYLPLYGSEIAIQTLTWSDKNRFFPKLDSLILPIKIVYLHIKTMHTYVTHEYVYMWLYVYIYIRIYIYVYIYASYMYIYVYIYIDVYVHIHMYSTSYCSLRPLTPYGIYQMAAFSGLLRSAPQDLGEIGSGGFPTLASATHGFSQQRKGFAFGVGEVSKWCGSKLCTESVTWWSCWRNAVFVWQALRFFSPTFFSFLVECLFSCCFFCFLPWLVWVVFFIEW